MKTVRQEMKGDWHLNGVKVRENELHEPKVKIEYDRQRSMEWVEIYCSVCGKEIGEYYYAGPAEIVHGNYCPNCGARLKEVDE